MTKPTGRPRGRPKTKAYVTLMARIPQDLADQVKHYATLHRQPISLVIREGLLLLLESGPYGHIMSDTKKVRAQTNIVYDRKEESATPAAEIMSYMKEESTESATKILSDTNMVKVSDRKAEVQEILSDKHRVAHKTSSRSSSIAPLDTTKYILGKLCPRQHDHEGTGYSLLRLSNRHCLACDREKAIERTQAKRQVE